ncbi:MAG: hypothetical protein DME55_13505 [Verrucomicrobia bacterium]|nr:MAG: hypothetical protein DME55_13505 [Verrucomicrobiota bacterium]
MFTGKLFLIHVQLDCEFTQSDDFASSLFRLMNRRVADPAGDPNSVRESRADRGERCAASRAFNGSSPTANLVSIIKEQELRREAVLAEVRPLVARARFVSE